MNSNVYIPPAGQAAIWTTDSIGSVFLSVVTILLSVAAIYAVGFGTFVDWSV